MSVTVHTFHCRDGEFTSCDPALVRDVLEPYLDPPGFVVGELALLRVGSDCRPYEIRIGGWDDRTDVVGGIVVHDADLHPDLWEVLLRLSGQAQMILMGDALGAIGCLAATQKVVEAMPTDTLEDFGPPVITTDTRVAIAAMNGESM